MLGFRGVVSLAMSSIVPGMMTSLFAVTRSRYVRVSVVSDIGPMERKRSKTWDGGDGPS